jgi:hypothetical protein
VLPSLRLMPVTTLSRLTFFILFCWASKYIPSTWFANSTCIQSPIKLTAMTNRRELPIAVSKMNLNWIRILYAIIISCRLQTRALVFDRTSVARLQLCQGNVIEFNSVACCKNPSSSLAATFYCTISPSLLVIHPVPTSEYSPEE